MALTRAEHREPGEIRAIRMPLVNKPRSLGSTRSRGGRRAGTPIRGYCGACWRSILSVRINTFMPRRYQIHTRGELAVSRCRGGGEAGSRGEGVVGGSDECLINEGTGNGTVCCTREHFVILALSSSESHESFMTPRIDADFPSLVRGTEREREREGGGGEGRGILLAASTRVVYTRFAWVIRNCFNVYFVFVTRYVPM